MEISLAAIHEEVQRQTVGTDRPVAILANSETFAILWSRLSPNDRGSTLTAAGNGLSVTVHSTDIQIDGIRVLEVPALPAAYLVLPPPVKLTERLLGA